MTYYRIIDDLRIPTRWHLGRVLSAIGETPSFLNGHRVDVQTSLSISKMQKGCALDFSLTSFAVPVVSDRLAKILLMSAGSDVQLLDVSIPGMQGFKIVNVTNKIACLNEEKSEFVKWLPEDNRLDRLGGYRQVTKLTINETDIPRETMLFRIEGWEVVLAVSSTIKALFEKHGCFGAIFEPLQSSELNRM